MVRGCQLSCHVSHRLKRKRSATVGRGTSENTSLSENLRSYCTDLGMGDKQGKMGYVGKFDSKKRSFDASRVTDQRHKCVAAERRRDGGRAVNTGILTELV